MLLTVWNQEKDMIKVRSYIKKMFYYLRNGCIIFYSSKTISNKWWAGLIKQLPLMSKCCLQLLHMHGITLEQVALVSLMWKTSVSSFMKISLTLGGKRQRVRALRLNDSVRSVCMQMTQCQIISKVNCWYLSLLTECHYLSQALLIPPVLLCKQCCAEQQKKKKWISSFFLFFLWYLGIFCRVCRVLCKGDFGRSELKE